MHMPASVASKPCPQCGNDSSIHTNVCLGCGFSFPMPAASNPVPITRILCILAGLILVAVAVLVGTVHYLVSSTGAFKQAITLAKASADVQNSLGEGIKVQFPVIGLNSGDGGSQFTEFSVRLAGSRGNGHLYGVANALNGVWEFSRLSFLADGAAKKIDLAPVPRLLPLPPVSAKKIYLIPMDLAPTESLDWAPAYYKAKLGVDVEVLAANPLPGDVLDPRRHQVDSERLIEHLWRTYPELARDPANILIAVTSRDIFIRTFGWSYAENFRHNGRFAVVSSARFHPPLFLGRWNPEWRNSRLQKMLTKNVAILYFDLPLSSDYTSLLSGGRLSGHEADLMSGSIIGGEGAWDPLFDSGDFEVTLYAVPGEPLIWRLIHSNERLPQASAHVFNSDLTMGLFSDRKTDFLLDGDTPLKFTRTYRNQDDASRPFGIGANDSLDLFLVGHPGVYIELIFEDGSRVHFVHVPRAAGQAGDTYEERTVMGSPFSHALAVYAGGKWTIVRPDGWKFYFPYRPKALGSNITVLTGFADPSGHRYEMVRNESGDLLSMTTPSGQWLHFKRDSQHRVHSITASTGRTVTYDYDDAGRLSHTIDSEGNQERYTYDNKNNMLSIALGLDAPILVNTYDVSSNIATQTMAGGGKFEYKYVRDPRGGSNVLPYLITTPNRLSTFIEYNASGYTQSLPLSVPH